MNRYPLVYKPNMVKNTDDTLKFETRLFSGTIRKIKIDIPSGHNYSAGLRFEIKGSKNGDVKLPRREEGSEIYFLGNDDDLDLSPDIEVYEGSIAIFGSNGDAVNDHLFAITIEIEERRSTF